MFDMPTNLSIPRSASSISAEKLDEMLELQQANMASAFHKRLKEQIRFFEAALSEEEEVGVRLVSFGQTITFHVEQVYYHNPSLIIFQGTWDGHPVSLIQHVTQLSFLLVAMKREDPSQPKRAIGFGRE